MTVFICLVRGRLLRLSQVYLRSEAILGIELPIDALGTCIPAVLLLIENGGRDGLALPAVLGVYLLGRNDERLTLSVHYHWLSYDLYSSYLLT